MTTLAERRCEPCHKGTPRLTSEEAERLLTQLRGWSIAEGRLKKAYKFPDFAAALAFVNRVGETAEREDHHPDLSFGWGYARIEIHTHVIGGLSESDFVLAAKIDALE